MDWKEWGARLKKHMRAAKITQDDVAEAMGITQGAVAHWLGGRRSINLEDFFALCAHAKADPLTVLFGATQEQAALDDLRNLLVDHPSLKDMIGKAAAPHARVAETFAPAPRARKLRRYPSPRRKVRT